MAVYKKNNRWYTDIYADCRRIRQAVKIDGKNPEDITRRDALQIEAIRKAEVAQGIKLASTKKIIKLSKLSEKFLGWVNHNYKHPRREHDSLKQILEFFGNIDASKITLFRVEGYKKHRKDTGVSNSTINRELDTLRRMYNLAEEWELIHENPIKGLKKLKVPKRLPRVIKDWEFQALYESASERFKPILLTAYMTGMRRGEIRKLKWEDVDLDEGYIYVKDTKNSEDRSIPINPILLESLKELRNNTESHYVFTTNGRDNYLSEGAWKKAWSTALRKSGIDHCRFHDLRHTFVSNLIVNHKEDFATVMALSGHKDISMLKRYSHTREDAKKSAINNLKVNVKLSINRLINLI